jgi:N-methylhydantoinase B
MDDDLDLVTLEVIQEYLVATVREMRVAMIRTAHSSIIYEGHDFSCALLDAAGDLVAQSEDSPAHIVPLPWQVKEALRHFGGDLHAGDAVLVNDPYTSGTHMNDVAMIRPFFADGRLYAFTVVRAHWGDVGGMTPGSISGEATEIFQEGLRIPFTKVIDRGRPVAAVLDLIFANVRVPDEREGDFYAMLACCHTAAERLEELIGRFGRARLQAAMTALLDRAEARMRRALAAVPEGVYPYEDYLEAGPGGRPVPLRVAVEAKAGGLVVDFAGSAPQVKGPINCSLAVTAMGAFVAVKALFDPKGPINQGAFHPIEVKAPKGTIVNAEYPAASGGFTEMRRRVESAVMGALSAAAPAFVAGDIKGTSNHTYVGSVNPKLGRTTIFYEYPAGGTGGFLEADGSHATRAYDEGDFGSILPAEAVEIEHALLVERCELLRDSCGDGRSRGGLGMRREIRLLAAEGRFSELSDRNLVPPFGVNGGHAALPNRFAVRRDGKEIAPSAAPGKVSGFPLRAGDVVVVETAGGGGYGRPEERDPARVQADVEEGYVTAERADARYGVVIRDGAVDAAATAERRRRLAESRHLLAAAEDAADTFAEGRRIQRLHAADAARLGVGDGALVELVAERAAPLRAWAHIDDGIAQGTAPLGPTARRILGVEAGGRVEIRALGEQPARASR